MIIDFHTHAFPDALAAKALGHLLTLSDGKFLPVTDATSAGLIRYMDECGIDKSVLQPVITKPSQLVGVNEWAASVNGDRIISFGGIYPHTEDYKQAIDLVVSLGLKGLKLHPEYQDFTVDDPKMLPIYDYALSRGLILLFHAGFDPAYKAPYKSSPRQFASVLDEMRGGTIVVAHLGGYGEGEDVLRYLAGRDVYLDTSMGFVYYTQQVFLDVAKAHGTDKLLFGTDSPWSNAKPEIEALRAMPISDADKELIFCGNAKRILRLDN